MKKMVFFLFLLLLPNIVFASNLKLEELTITNGELSPIFDSLNNEYTVMLPKEEFTVLMEYKLEEGIEINVLENHDLENNSLVTIVLKKEKEETEYHLHILKEEENTTIGAFVEEVPEITSPFMNTYKIYIIPSTCFLLILLTYKILFHKHKK